MKIFYDTEFIDDGKTIDLISIGMVAEDGDEYYAVNADLNLSRLQTEDNWLMENVVPSLPIVSDGQLTWDMMHKDWVCLLSKEQMAIEVATFLQQKSTTPLELWAWYGAYDHVVLAQLWGPMKNLPSHIPMYTNDLKQEVTRLEKLGHKRLRFELPKQEANEHNALADARHLKLRYEWVQNESKKY